MIKVFMTLILTILVTSVEVFAEAQPHLARKIAELVGKFHLESCEQILGKGSTNSWAQEDFSTLDPELIFHVLENRAQRLNKSVEDYVNMISNPEKAPSALAEIESFKRLFSIETLGASDLSIFWNPNEPRFEAFHTQLAALITRDGYSEGENYIRVFGLGEKNADFTAVVDLVKIQARWVGLTEEEFCRKYRLRFGFYDIRPSVLSSAAFELRSISRTLPWLANRTELRFMNFTENENYAHIKSNSTLLTICRNTFRGEIATLGRTVLDQFLRFSTSSGWLVTDGSGAGAIEQFFPQLKQVFHIPEHEGAWRPGDWDRTISVWKSKLSR